MKIFKLDEHAYLPTINYLGDAGIDFYALHDYLILEHSITVINTGIGVIIPDGYVGLLKPKGGSDWLIGAGVIDQNYRGEILFKMYHSGLGSFILAEGNPVGQMIFLKNLAPTGIEEIDKGVVADTNRGDSGGIIKEQTSDYYNSLGIKKWD